MSGAWSIHQRTFTCVFFLCGDNCFAVALVSPFVGNVGERFKHLSFFLQLAAGSCAAISTYRV
jgi:hypothetical protein